jgi:hypothetical protein
MADEFPKHILARTKVGVAPTKCPEKEKLVDAILAGNVERVVVPPSEEIITSEGTKIRRRRSIYQTEEVEEAK